MGRRCYGVEILFLMDCSPLLSGVVSPKVCVVGHVGHNLTCTPQGPGGLQVLEGSQIAADHLLGGVNGLPLSLCT